MSEKRQFVRHPSSIPVEVRLLAGASESVCISDISMGGLAFAFHWPIAKGVRVQVSVPSVAEHICFSGRVVRCEGKGGNWLIGMAFEHEQDVFLMRMVQQICHIEEYRTSVLEKEGRSLSSNEAAAEWIDCHAAHFPRCGM